MPVEWQEDYNTTVKVWKTIKNYLIRGADRTEGENYPSREWGYGRLDIAGTFDVLAGI